MDRLNLLAMLLLHVLIKSHATEQVSFHPSMSSRWPGGKRSDISNMKTTVACLLLFFALEPVSAEYTDVWPLGDSTCGYDVIVGSDAIQPTLDVCCIETGSRHPALSYNSLAFSGTSYLDLSVQGDEKEEDLSFTVNFRPFKLSGTIFHFFEKLDSCDCLFDLRVDILTNGNLSIYLHVKDMLNGPKAFPTSIVVSQNNWNYLSVGLDQKSGEMVVVFEKYGSSKIDWSVDTGPDWRAHLKGQHRRLRVGANKEGSNGFWGEITCASIARKIKDPQYDKAIGHCQGTWPRMPPVVPGCSESPFWVIPTYKTNPGYDIMNNVSRRRQDDSKDLRVDPTQTDLNYGSLRLDGSFLSTVDLNIDHSIFKAHFTLTFYVKASQPTLGILAHVRMFGAAGTVIQEVVVSANVTHATAKFGNGGGSYCGQVTTFRSTSSASSWDVIGVGKDGGRLFVTYGNGIQEESDSCFTNPTLNGTGILRLGGSLDGGEGFHGNLACLALFKRFAYPAKFTIEACKASHSIPPENPKDKPTQETYRMSLLKSNFEPKNELMTGSDITPGSEFKVRSLADCAKECRLSRHCRSFTVAKVKDSSRERRCRLFDFLTTEGLQEKTGTNYYAVVEDKQNP